MRGYMDFINNGQYVGNEYDRRDSRFGESKYDKGVSYRDLDYQSLDDIRAEAQSG